MSRPLRLLLPAVALVAALAAAYLAGVYHPLSLSLKRPAPLHPAPGEAFVTTIETLDYAAAVDVLTQVRLRGSDVDAAHFEAFVDTLHRFVLTRIAHRLALTPGEHAAMLAAYEGEQRRATVDYGGFLGHPQADPVAAPSSVVTYRAYDSVNEFMGFFAGHACGLLDLPGRVLPGQVRGLAGQRLSCRDLLGETLAPLGRALRERAVLQDLSTSQLTLTAQVRRMVAELATAETHLTGDLTEDYTSRVLFLKSRATLKADVRATVKAGFDLNDGFAVDLDHTRRRFVVRLPAPEILSNEVEVSFTDADNGLFTSIDLPKYNAALVQARALMREQALRTGLLPAARRNAEQIVLAVFQPVMALPEFGYDVDVVFPGEEGADGQGAGGPEGRKREPGPTLAPE